MLCNCRRSPRSGTRASPPTPRPPTTILHRPSPPLPPAPERASAYLLLPRWTQAEDPTARAARLAAGMKVRSRLRVTEGHDDDCVRIPDLTGRTLQLVDVPSESRAEAALVALARELLPGDALYDDGEVLLYGEAG